MKAEPYIGKPNPHVYTRCGTVKGIATGAWHRCQLAGCTGRRLTVRWPGQITYPCTKGLKERADGALQIV